MTSCPFCSAPIDTSVIQPAPSAGDFLQCDNCGFVSVFDYVEIAETTDVGVANARIEFLRKTTSAEAMIFTIGLITDRLTRRDFPQGGGDHSLN